MSLTDPFAPPPPPDFTFLPGDDWPMRVAYLQVGSGAALGAPVDMTGDTVTGELWLRDALAPIPLTRANGLLRRFDPAAGLMLFDPGPALTASARPDPVLTPCWATRLVVRLTPDSAGDTRTIGIRTIRVLDPRCVDPATIPQGQVAALYSYLQGESGRTGAASTVPGPAGASAYEVAVSNGYVGSQAQWLASLVGPGLDLTAFYTQAQVDALLQPMQQAIDALASQVAALSAAASIPKTSFFTSVFNPLLLS